MLPRRIIACILFFFVLQVVQFAQWQLLLLLCQWRFHLHRLQLVLHYCNRFVRRRRRRLHPYWTLPRPCESWFEIHLHRRVIPEEFFFRRMRMSRNTFDILLLILLSLCFQVSHGVKPTSLPNIFLLLAETSRTVS